jgi:putative Ca2+/H+ antiporter (TMEM165/GDT1 family)
MAFEFDQLTTGVVFAGLLAVLIGGTFMSPMQTSTVAMVSGGLLAFGVVTLLLGVKHGEYRAQRS